MKVFLISVSILLMFTGCATKSAFSKFDMTPKQELSASSLQSNKIISGNKVDGVFSAIYLNEIYPDSFNQNEYFFVTIFLKNKQEMHDPNSLDDVNLVLKLNSKLPIKIKELAPTNQFSHLVSIQNSWSSYYLVAFEEDKEKKLNLVLESGQSSSAALRYQKDEQ